MKNAQYSIPRAASWILNILLFSSYVIISTALLGMAIGLLDIVSGINILGRAPAIDKIGSAAILLLHVVLAFVKRKELYLTASR